MGKKGDTVVKDALIVRAIIGVIMSIVKTQNRLDWIRPKMVVIEHHSQHTLCRSRCKINSSAHLLLFM